MKTLSLSISALALLASTTAPLAEASAQPRHHHYRHYSHYGRGCHSRHMTNGTIIGSIGGGIVGGAMSHGNALPAVALGAGLGALAGHAVGARSGC